MFASLKIARLSTVTAMASRRMMSTKLEPLFDRVLVKKIEAEAQTKGGIMLPENQTKTHNGTVVAVGTGARSREGDFYKPILKAGDKVMLPEYGGNKVDIGGETHYVYRESDIIGRWN
ncbi:10 kDa heat shock, mitochondrial-like [Olea europaea subsp. europaea]|uniref:Protein groES n=1 Tax=Olea europaea subsp. europaea TaxID=158383 RepID=A0A8S0Q6J9_OLEEU|nr:10 kDa heat shock, mitochondrial-like [Olea europaea subsp. europaea]